MKRAWAWLKSDDAFDLFMKIAWGAVWGGWFLGYILSGSPYPF